MTVRAVEGKKPYTGGTAIEIDENKVISLRLRDENNLIIYDSGDNEIYVDLQLDDEITPTSAFPIGVNTGRVVVDNGWDKAGTIISAKTTSGDVIKLLYADDGTLWIDNGTGTFKQIYFKADVDAIIATLTAYINAELAKKQNGVVSATAPSNPAQGDLWYDTTSNSMKVYDGTNWNAVGTGGGGSDIVYATQAEYNALLPGALTDNKHYFIYTSSTPSGWDMNNRALAQTSSALSGNWWGGIALKPDGTKMYLTGFGGYAIEYSLSTPFDISSYTQTYSISTSVEDIHFSPDGTKMYLLTNNGAKITRYDLSTAWDMSTATQVQQISAISNGRGLYISPDGTKVFVSRHQDNSSTYMGTLSTAWDLSTVGTFSQVTNFSGLSCWFGNNGTMYFTQKTESTSDLTYFTCSTPYDLSTATESGTKNIGACRAGGIWFDDNGTMCFMVGGGNTTNYVTKYTL